MRDDSNREHSEPDAPDKLLLELDRSRRDQAPGSEVLRLAVRSYRGKRFADLRVFWTGDDGHLRPGKGCSVRTHELRQVIVALERAEAELGAPRPGVGGASFSGRREPRDPERPPAPGTPRGTTEPRRPTARHRESTAADWTAPEQQQLGDQLGDFEADGERSRA